MSGKIGRRQLVGGLAFGGGLLASRAAMAEPQRLDVASIKKETEVACVYHCDFDEPARVRAMIRNISNHLSVYDNDPFKVKIVVVAHSVGIKMFLKDLDGTPWSKDPFPSEIFERFAGVAKLGVDAYLCQITFKGNNIDLEKARTDAFIKLVPSGVATVAALQGKGYSYLKVG